MPEPTPSQKKTTPPSQTKIAEPDSKTEKEVLKQPSEKTSDEAKEKGVEKGMSTPNGMLKKDWVINKWSLEEFMNIEDDE